MVKDPEQGTPVRVEPNSELCEDYSIEELAQIPHISENVKAALDFLGKASEGFFLVYEQGDVSLAIHFEPCRFAPFNRQMHCFSLFRLTGQLTEIE